MRWMLGFVALSTLSLAAGGLAAACGGSAQNGSQPLSDDGGSESAVATDAPAEAAVDAGPDVGYPAPHYAMPQVVNLAGGPTLKNPKVYLIFYPGYTYEAQLTAMAQAIGASSYWSAATSEYGVGPAQYAGSIELTGETPPTTIQDSDIQTYLEGKLQSGAFGTPDPETIYTIVYPKTTTVTLPSGSLGNAQSCQTFGGYHQDFIIPITDGGKPMDFPYAVIPTCSSVQGMTEQDGVTGALSHEWIEAATDPYPATNQGANSAYAQVDFDHFAWEALGGGGETGDMCVGEQNAFFKDSTVGFNVQRTWSNKLAKAGHDPCAPNLPGVPYFQSAPMLTENVSFTSQFIGGTVDTQGVTIPVGQSKTIEVDLFSDAPTDGPWTVTATDGLSALLGLPTSMTFTWDKTQGQNGDKLQLTIKVTTSDAALGGAHVFVITSTLKSSVTKWAGLVVE